MNKTPELSYLIEEVSKCFGGKVETTTDFDTLAEQIAGSTGERISPSTLKRLWGYVSLQPRQRTSTLDILARYVGRNSFRELCLELQETSAYFSVENIRTRDLDPGTELELRWMPDRIVRIKYLGEQCFSVTDPGRSKLKAGDLLWSIGFIRSQPLYLDVEREGRKMPPYVAGRAKGLTGIQVFTAARQ